MGYYSDMRDRDFRQAQRSYENQEPDYDERKLEKYRVWLDGSSMSARYDGYVDVVAEDEEDAKYRAKRELTKPNGTFHDWSPSMFRVTKVERVI